MKICLVCHEATLTGAPRVGFDIARFLRANHDVALISKLNGPLIKDKHYQSLMDEYYCTSSHHSISNVPHRVRVKNAMELLGEIQPDVVYVNSVAAGEWCEASKRAGAQVVLHTHELLPSLTNLLKSGVYRSDILHHVDVLIGASKQTIIDLLKISPGFKGDTFEFGISIDTAHVLRMRSEPVSMPRNAAGTAMSDERPIVTMSGTAEKRKGPDLFLDVASRLPQCNFLWIGPWHPSEAPRNVDVYDRYKRAALENFYVTGLVDNPYAYLDLAQIFLLTSRVDPNPLVVPEALTLGKQVVAFAETGDSRKLLERFGYVQSGHPSVSRMVDFIPKLLHAPKPAWLDSISEEVMKLLDVSEKLPEIDTIICNISAQRDDGWNPISLH